MTFHEAEFKSRSQQLNPTHRRSDRFFSEVETRFLLDMAAAWVTTRKVSGSAGVPLTIVARNGENGLKRRERQDLPSRARLMFPARLSVP
jgi:hypothetical protein